MKRITALVLIACLLLCGCGAKAEAPQAPTEPAAPVQTTAAAATEATEAPTTEPTAEPTTVPTTEPAPVYRNPLTGFVQEEPWTKRIFAVSIGNGKGSHPHMGVAVCDVLFESFVNGSTTRRFAMYSDMAAIEAVGGCRSMRYQFTDMAQAYDAIAVYAGGSDVVMGDLKTAGINGIIAQQWGADFHYRDTTRDLEYEHNLIVKGPEVVAYAQELGYDVTQDPERDYGFRFTDGAAAPEGGEEAQLVNVAFTMGSTVKDTTFTYYPDMGVYSLSQYGFEGTDGYYYMVETFKNVFVLLCQNTNQGSYHVVNTLGSGDGWFACEGRIIPIRWHRETDTDPFTFTLSDGTPLYQGIGTSYIALAPTESNVTWSETAEMNEPNT